MYRFLMALGLLIGLSGCAEPPYNNLDNAGLQKLLEQGVPIFDIRRAEEWRQTGVIAGSEKLTFVDAAGRLQPDFLPKFTAQINPQDPVILICRTGNRTASLARLLTDKLGYSKVYNVEDGITHWIRSGGPVLRN
ncbi:MAG: rhodanese-like domain-containing protein [Chromatiales bacterium]|jgi:rhodanese-related sulfurtransferase